MNSLLSQKINTDKEINKEYVAMVEDHLNKIDKFNQEIIDDLFDYDFENHNYKSFKGRLNMRIQGYKEMLRRHTSDLIIFMALCFCIVAIINAMR